MLKGNEGRKAIQGSEGNLKKFAIFIGTRFNLLIS